MTRFIALLALSTILTACPGPDDTGNTDDTGENPNNKGFLLVTLEVDGTDLDADVEADNGQNVLSGVTDEAFEVPVGDWDVYAGDFDSPTADGLPTVMVSGLSWVAPPGSASMSKDSETGIVLVANRYMENPSLTCHSLSGTDFDEGHIFVKDGYKLELTKTLGNGSWIEVKVGKLVLAGQMVGMGASLTANQSVGSNTLYFELDDGYEIYKYTCD